MANITVTSPQETLNFNYDVNGTNDGEFTGTASKPDITMYIYSAATEVSYGDSSSKTNTGITSTIGSHNSINGNLIVTVTNNSTSVTTNPIYFDVTIAGNNFTSNISSKTLLVTSPTGGILAPSSTGTATIEVTHSGSELSDTATITVNLYEYYGGEYIAITPSSSGTVTVSISAAILSLATVVSGQTEQSGAYYLKSGDTFNYDITISNTGNAVSKNTKITIVSDSANLTIGEVIGSTSSDFSNPTTLTGVSDVYTLSDIAASTGVYYVRVPETVK